MLVIPAEREIPVDWIEIEQLAPKLGKTNRLSLKQHLFVSNVECRYSVPSDSRSVAENILPCSSLLSTLGAWIGTEKIRGTSLPKLYNFCGALEFIGSNDRATLFANSHSVQ
ncbi:hypothetical protein GcC1_191007 [Golovinomyces cichoracearum]|uniref:Uncharacterized protein n=1 Tax=Golovinomyces cichoracearum TaxID=62708 RepID=A0A420HI91_9PEZI|nr:hypothetical protein GcC1_191007 [Golovinomyces cichoracearum]